MKERLFWFLRSFVDVCSDRLRSAPDEETNDDVLFAIATKVTRTSPA